MRIAELAAIGRNGRYRDGEQQELLPDDDKPPLPEGLWGYPDGPFDVAAPGGKPFYLRRRQVRGRLGLQDEQQS